MANAKKTSLKNDGGFVASIVTDPRNPPRVQLFSGYPGAAAEEGHLRLYAGPELADYLEIPTAAILYRQDFPASAFPPGGALLWVECGAEIVRGHTWERLSEASFLGPAGWQARPGGR